MPPKNESVKSHSIFSNVLITFFIAVLTFFNANVSGQTKYDYHPISEIEGKRGKWGIKVRKNWIVPPDYDSIRLNASKATHGRTFTYWAWKSGKIDVYLQKSLAPVLTEISIMDTIHIGYFSVFNAETTPVLESTLCGWKHKHVVIKPEFDSIRLAYDYNRDIYLDEIVVYKNGQMGLMSKFGAVLVPLGNYSNFGNYIPGYTLTYKKAENSTQMLWGIYFNEKISIPPIYASIKPVGPITLKDKFYDRGFYHCVLPNGETENFIKNDSALIELPDDISIAYKELIRKEESSKQEAKSKEDERRNWAKQLVFFARGGAVGIKDADGNVFFPAAATTLEFGRYTIDPDGDTINITMTSPYRDKDKLTWSYKSVYSLFYSKDNLMIDDIVKHGFKAELYPFNNISNRYGYYFDVTIDKGFNYTSGFPFISGICPHCDGDGKEEDGYTTETSTVTYDEQVKDGTTTIAKKNYLANERVDASGRKYTPTTYQTFDNYKTVRRVRKEVTKTRKYKTCTICSGKKRYKSASIIWDDKRNEFVLTAIYF
ncbi:MAG TPA: hypothetical protein DCQ34_02100 [Chitinophagaceae bacterium]|nr:hypothetical protein [Chitinophagaceae bacterium]